MTEFKYGLGAYEITINPSDKNQFFGSYGKRLQQFYTTVHPKIIKALNYYQYKYDLVLELSDPHINVNRDSSQPRLHFHGVIEFQTQEQVGYFLLESLYKLSRWSNVTVNEYRGEEWNKYITKQGETMMALCKKERVPHTISDQSALVKRAI